MSYDVSIMSPERWEHYFEAQHDWRTEHECPGVQLEVGNYTSNVSPMWETALQVSRRVAMADAVGLSALHGVPCGVAAGYISGGIDRMVLEPELYRAMEPSNGWGDYEGALQYLRDILAQCVKPDLREWFVEVSR